MISGQVALLGEIAGRQQLLEPRVSIPVSASNDGVPHTVAATVDTGFTGLLTLPPGIIKEFGLQFWGRRRIKLANGRLQRLNIYLGFITWHDRPVRVQIHQLDSSPLLGMGLLAGSRLTVESVPGGEVRIEELSPG